LESCLVYGLDTVAAASRGRAEDRTSHQLAHRLLVGVCLAYLLIVALRTSQSMALTWDEVVYASQVARDVPAAGFSAPRSRGMPVLLAPVAALTSAVFPLRVYLSLGSALLMYLAFRPWLAVLPERGRSVYVPPLAAGLFSTLWLTVLYGTMAYPNLWLAFVLVGGTGYYCIAMRQRPVRAPTILAIVLAYSIASLLRPTDALAAAGPLLLAPVLHRASRQLAPLAATLTGLAVGWGAWIVEAFFRYSGPLQRLREGAELNEGGFTWSLPKHLDALGGPYLLCRPPDLCEGTSWPAVSWLVLLPILVVVGAVVAHRADWTLPAILAVGCAVSVAAPYLIMVDYAAPRFLLPSYALLLLPTAAALLWLGDRAYPPARIVAIASLVCVIAIHGGVQQAVFNGANDHLLRIARSHATQANFLRHEEGVRPPCLFVGQGAIQQSYILRCRSAPADHETFPEREASIAEALRQGETVVVRLRASEPVPEYLASWERIDLPGPSSYVAFVPPDR
jgi:hypothetical protein